MDKKNVLIIAQKFVALLRANFDCKQVILFGSYAKGTNQDESDIDIAVILGEFENLFDIQMDLMRLRRKIDSRIEPHPFREKDFTLANPIANEILKYGQTIYRQAD